MHGRYSRFRPAGQAYRFGPSGLRFRDPALLTLKYKNETGLPDDLIDIFYHNPDTGRWERMPRVALDTVNKTVTAEITHFSTYAPGIEIGLVEEGISPYRTYFEHNQEKVDPATGNLFIESEDLRIPGRGLDLVVKRRFSLANYWDSIELVSYSTMCMNGYVDPPYEFTNGWQFCFPYLCKSSLYTENNNVFRFNGLVGDTVTVTHRGSDGYVIYTTPIVIDEFYVYDRWEEYLKAFVRHIEIPREGLILVCTFDYKGTGPNPYPAPPPLIFALRTVELITADGRTFQFEKGSKCYRVSQIYDKSKKNCLTFYYSNDRLSKIRDNIGREVTFTYSGNEIQIKYQGVTCVNYTLGVGEKPELTSVTIPINAQDNAVTEYSYGDGRNIRITYPSGGQSEYTVNKESRVARSFHRASNGGSIIKDLTYTYLTNTNNIYPYSGISYISSNGYQIEYKYTKRVLNPRWTGPYTTGPDSNEYIGFGYSIENERIHKDANGTVLTKTVRTYSVPWYINIPCLVQEDEYRGSTKVYSKYYEYEDFGQPA